LSYGGLGLLASLLLYVIGHLLYAGSFENWYVYIGKSYKIPPGISSDDHMGAEYVFGEPAFFSVQKTLGFTRWRNPRPCGI